MSRHFSFPPKDEPLRRDVGALGALVGDILREQGPEALFESVEALRRAAIDRREGRGEPGPRPLDAVVREDPDQVGRIVRAFSTYFLVVNLAERVHRVRRRRDYLREGVPQPGGFEDSLRAMKDRGWTLDDVSDLLGRMRIEPVFTAHPTQATRPAILDKQQRIARRLLDRLDSSMTAVEDLITMRRVRTEITTAWQTEEYPPHRPTVADEREQVLFYLTDVIYDAVPSFYEALENALAAVWGSEAQQIAVPSFLRFGSWVGGDMDGNPNVTAETIEAALRRHRALIMRLYRREVIALSRRLTQSPGLIPVDPEVIARIDDYAELFPEVRSATSPRHRDMPYRLLLRLAAARLDATRRDEPRGYAGPEDFQRDIHLIHASLRRHSGEHSGAFSVRRLIRRIETFGFHLATLDVRQSADVHRACVGRLLDETAWPTLSPAQRTARIEAALAARAEPRRDPGSEDRRTLSVFEALGTCLRDHGPRAVGPFIISMTGGPDDILGVILLARWAGLTTDTGGVPIDVVPLLETVDDLDAGAGILSDLIAAPSYADHLRDRGGHQMIMIGYSDSNKDSGFAASRWALHRAQISLRDALEARSVRPIFFHGRGGSISRGGGSTLRAVLSGPAGSVRGAYRTTEQGEAIDARYGLRQLALRHLEQMTAAVTLSDHTDAQDEARARAGREIMEEVAARSRAAYRALVYEDPDFLRYFRQATPIDVIERMPIGSRPARRGGEGGVESLRAIPWVFAWTQSRHYLTGWFGLGRGLEAARDRFGEKPLRDAASGWPFLAGLIADAATVLAKADMPIAEHYAALADTPLRRFFDTIRDEHTRTVNAILSLTGCRDLLDDSPALQRGIRLRNPYVDPMSLLQCDLLARWRATGCRDDAIFRALLATVHGIAKGLQSTG